MLKRLVAVLSCVTLVPAVWGGPTPLGSVAAARNTTLSGVPAVLGATVYDGDTIGVSPSGGASVNLLDGSRFEMSAGSEVRLRRDGKLLAVALAQGGAILSAVSGSSVEGVVGDISFRPSGPGPAAGLFAFTAPGRAVFYAEKGSWVAAERDGRSVVLSEGKRVAAGIVAPEQAGQESVQGKKKKKRRVAAIFFLFGGAIAGLGIGISQIFPGQPICVYDPGGNLGATACPAPVTSPTVP